MGHPQQSLSLLSPSLETVILWRKCLSHVLARFGTLPLALHTWTATPSKQQTAYWLRLRVAAIYTQITLHNPEQARILYFMFPCLCAPAILKGHRNIKIRCTVCQKIRLSILQWMWPTIPWKRVNLQRNDKKIM